MASTRRSEASVAASHHAPLIVVHILVSLALWFLIYAVARTVFFG